jgi:hypothetical protein
MGIHCTCDNCGKEGQLVFSFVLLAWKGPDDWLVIAHKDNLPDHEPRYHSLPEYTQVVCSEECRLQLQEKGPHDDEPHHVKTTKRTTGTGEV